MILLVVLSAARLDFSDPTQTGDEVVPIADPGIRPLDIVMPSVSRGLASLRSPRGACSAGEEWRAEVRRAAHDLFDVNNMARRALGHHWKRLLPEEQHEFIRLFNNLLTQSFVTIVQRYPGDTVPPLLDEEIAGTFAQVRSRIAPGSEIAIEYRLSRSDPHWMVYDIVFEGVSLVSTYRSQFTSILGTSAVAQLLERMRTEPSRRPPCREAVDRATTDEHETSVRGRLAAGLLLAATHARRR